MKRLAKKIFAWEEELLFRPRWHSILFNPYFIARYRLLERVKNFARMNAGGKKILDVGCGIKPYAKLFPNDSYTGIDIRGGGHSDSQKMVDKFYDGEHIPYGDNEFDIVICTQVFEHAVKLKELIEEIRRVLKHDGILFFTMPFVWPEHEAPYDFRRYTRFAHQKLLDDNDFNQISIQTTSGVFATCGH